MEFQDQPLCLSVSWTGPSSLRIHRGMIMLSVPAVAAEEAVDYMLTV